MNFLFISNIFIINSHTCLDRLSLLVKEIFFLSIFLSVLKIHSNICSLFLQLIFFKISFLEILGLEK